MHTGECSMVHNREARVETLRGAIEEVGKTVREVCGDEEEDEDAKDGRGRYEEDRWYYEVEGVCRGNVLLGERDGVHNGGEEGWTCKEADERG